MAKSIKSYVKDLDLAIKDLTKSKTLVHLLEREQAVIDLVTALAEEIQQKLKK